MVFKQLLWTSNDLYKNKEFGEIVTYHSIGILYSDFLSLWHISKQKSEFCKAMSRICVDPTYVNT